MHPTSQKEFSLTFNQIKAESVLQSASVHLGIHQNMQFDQGCLHFCLELYMRKVCNFIASGLSDLKGCRYSLSSILLLVGAQDTRKSSKMVVVNFDANIYVSIIVKRYSSLISLKIVDTWSLLPPSLIKVKNSLRLLSPSPTSALWAACLPTAPLLYCQKLPSFMLPLLGPRL